MEKVIHNWDEKLLLGHAGEAALDNYFKQERGLVIKEADMDWQHRGVDRWFIRQGFWNPVEYKTDFRAAQTGNVFLETRKNCNGLGKAGWAKTTLAALVHYYIPPLGIIYTMKPTMWKDCPQDLEEYRTAKAHNATYSAEGVLVPLEEVRRWYTYTVYDRAPKFETEESLLEWFRKSETE